MSCFTWNILTHTSGTKGEKIKATLLIDDISSKWNMAKQLRTKQQIQGEACTELLCNGKVLGWSFSDYKDQLPPRFLLFSHVVYP